MAARLAMSFEVAKTLHNKLNSAVDDASAILQQFPKGDAGLTPDAVKFSPEFRAAKTAFEYHFKLAREFNGLYNRTFKRELASERKSRRQA